MYRCLTSIFFVPKTNLDERNLPFTSFAFDFVNRFECTDSWVDLTNQLKVTFPKNIYVRDQNNQLQPLGGTQPYIQISNLFRRGDFVSVSYGYYTYDTAGNEGTVISQVFTGYISKVTSKKPIQLECEDNMWLLKQIPCKPQVWPKSKTVEALLKTLLRGTAFTVNALTDTTVGDLQIQNESVAQLLLRLRKDYHLESYFKGNELRVGSVIYVDPVPPPTTRNKFIFQQNIISDELTYQRKDDIKLSAVCKSYIAKQGTKLNKQGQLKTSTTTVEVLVFNDASGKFKHIVKQKEVDFPPNDEGERRTLFFPDISDPEKLAQRGIDELKKYYYDGFRGSFTTFAIPLVQLGDNIAIEDKLLPDRNGVYKVRSVKYSGGVDGHRQKIELEFKFN